MPCQTVSWGLPCMITGSPSCDMQHLLCHCTCMLHNFLLTVSVLGGRNQQQQVLLAAAVNCCRIKLLHCSRVCWGTFTLGPTALLLNPSQPGTSSESDGCCYQCRMCAHAGIYQGALLKNFLESEPHSAVSQHNLHTFFAALCVPFGRGALGECLLLTFPAP